MRTTLTASHRWLATMSLFVALALASSQAFAAVGTAFTYQGRIAQSGTTVNGPVDLQFEVYDQVTGGTSVGGPLSLANVICTDGLFTVTLDFGATTFNGARRWLEIRVSPDFPTTAYTTLTPRQELTPQPYAIWSDTAGNALDADHADLADNATNAVNAQNAVNATNAVNAQTAVNAQNAVNATNATNANNANLLDNIDSTGFALVNHTHPGTAISGIAANAVVFGTGTGITGDGTNFSYDPTAHDLSITGVYRIGANSVLRVAPALDNTFAGLSGNAAVTGTANTAIGDGALAAAGASQRNTAVGNNALAVTVGSAGTNGNFNTAVGSGALAANTNGFANVAVGTGALAGNTTGFINTAIGANALTVSTTATGVVAVGANALAANTSGSDSVAVGTSALGSNTTGVRNTAVGQAALNANTTGGDNTAMGALALQKNTIAGQNTAIGASSMLENLTGVGNTAYGAYTLDANVLGNNNTAIGNNSLGRNLAANNTAVGAGALDEVTTGANNIGVGVDAGGVIATGSNNVVIGGGIFTTGSNNIVIGHPGIAAEDAHIRIGTNGVHTDTRLGGVTGIAIVGPGVPVLINANGQLGTSVASSAQYKEDVQDMGAKAEQLLALRPVTFRYREGVAPEGDPRDEQYGLIAEEVAQVNPDWAMRDAKGEIVGVRYDQVNAALLGLVQRQQAQIDALAEQVRALSEKAAAAKAADTP